MRVAELGWPARRTRNGALGRGLLRGALASLLCAGLLLTACSEDEEQGGPTGPTYTAEELNDMGWAAFDDGTFTTAVSYFEQALAKSPGLHEARLGLAWGLSHTGAYEDAVTAFDALIAAGAYTADAYAGRAAASLQIDPALAIDSAETTLDLDDDYRCERIPTFDHLDLRLIMAEAHFALAQYAEAQAQVDLLDPDNGLDPQDPGYVTDLALAIEVLRERVAG